MGPMQNLRDEHGQMMKMFSALQQRLPELAHADQDLFTAVDSILAFFEINIDGCHHGKEEDILFPALAEINAGDVDRLIADLRADHSAGRRLLGEIKTDYYALRMLGGPAVANFANSAMRYINHFRKHIRIENARLLPLLQSRLSTEVQARMDAQFDAYQQKILGSQTSA